MYVVSFVPACCSVIVTSCRGTREGVFCTWCVVSFVPACCFLIIAFQMEQSINSGIEGRGRGREYGCCSGTEGGGGQY